MNSRRSLVGTQLVQERGREEGCRMWRGTGGGRWVRRKNSVLYYINVLHRALFELANNITFLMYSIPAVINVPERYLRFFLTNGTSSGTLTKEIGF